MTFWISVIGIPRHFWMDPIFESLGRRLGTVGPIEARATKVQVEINMDLPLKFALRAQLPSGEIVPVKLVYSNLHRYCRHCRRISHELESCPLLTEALSARNLKPPRIGAVGRTLTGTPGIAFGNALTPGMIHELILALKPALTIGMRRRTVIDKGILLTERKLVTCLRRQFVAQKLLLQLFHRSQSQTPQPTQQDKIRFLQSIPERDLSGLISNREPLQTFCQSPSSADPCFT